MAGFKDFYSNAIGSALQQDVQLSVAELLCLLRHKPFSNLVWKLTFRDRSVVIHEGKIAILQRLKEQIEKKRSAIVQPMGIQQAMDKPCVEANLVVRFEQCGKNIETLVGRSLPFLIADTNLRNLVRQRQQGRFCFKR